MNQKYELSGRAGNIWPIGLPLGAVLSIILSIIYAYIMVYNPFIYFNLFIFIGFLIGIFFIQSLVVNIAKCRSTSATRIYGTLIGLFILYTNWSTFLYVILQRYDLGMPLMEILADPIQVVQLMSIIAEDGYYSIFGIDVSGIVLWIFWIIEAIGIVVAGIFGGQHVLHEEVFCEDCNRWAEDINLDLRLSLENKEAVDAAIERNIGALAEAPTTKFDYPHLKVIMHHCSQCDNFSTINLDKVRREFKKDKYVEKSEDYTDVFVISNEEHQAFKKAKEQAVQQNDLNEPQSEDDLGTGEVKPAGM